MLRSLVGSEMCIRDRFWIHIPPSATRFQSNLPDYGRAIRPAAHARTRHRVIAGRGGSFLRSMWSCVRQNFNLVCSLYVMRLSTRVTKSYLLALGTTQISSYFTKHWTKFLTHQTGNYPVTCFVSKPSRITLVELSCGAFFLGTLRSILVPCLMS